jgi:anthranilate/para-aminobenzoate synthase component I
MTLFECSECMYRSENKYNVKRHIDKKCHNAVINEIYNEIKCDNCDKKFSAKSSLKRHEKTCKPSNTQVEELKNDIKELQNEIKQLKYNNKITNIQQNIQQQNIQQNNIQQNIIIQMYSL